MKYIKIVNFLTSSVLIFSFSFMRYMNIEPCFFCILARWLFFLSLSFSWLALFNHMYLYVSLISLLLNCMVGLTSMYFLINEIEPLWCRIGYSSCIEWNTFLALPMQFWITFFSCIILFFIYKAIKSEFSNLKQKK